MSTPNTFLARDKVILFVRHGETESNEIIHNIPYRSEYNIRKNNKLDGKRASEIMDRQMFAQTCQNPFLNKNYTDVLSDQDKFMKPQNSSIQNE